MAQAREERSEEAKAAGTLSKADTVLGALSLMQHRGSRRMQVVDEVTGAWLGDITEEELYRMWATAPLAQMGEILLKREALFLIHALASPETSNSARDGNSDPECAPTFH